jgi:SOS-response transcriptional repressor LexA
MSEAEGISSGFGTVRLPILGVVAAGDGVRSSSDDPEPEEREVFPPACGADYLLKVTGDSMVGAGIHEGDLLQIKRQETARPGQIVIAHVPEQGMVVKRLTETPRGRELASENPAYLPIPVTEGVAIQGVVVKQEREL